MNEEAKAAILEYFRVRKVEPIEVGPFAYLDKIPLKRDYAERGVRVVPPATARYGSFLSPGVILMPSYVNIGAWVGPNTMVDTWATVGSCAQIGADVHLGGGVGIGGVLEPVNARPGDRRGRRVPRLALHRHRGLHRRRARDPRRRRRDHRLRSDHRRDAGRSRSSIAGTCRRARSSCRACARGVSGRDLRPARLRLIVGWRDESHDRMGLNDVLREFEIGG